MAVFTKYDVLIESLKPPGDLDESLEPPNEEEFYGDIEKEIETSDKVVPDVDSNTGPSASQIDPHVLSLAEDKFCKMITPFKETFGVPWVKVSGLHILPFILNARSS